MMHRLILVVFFFQVFSNLTAQEKFSVIKDLRSAWQIYEAGSYKPNGDTPFIDQNTLYFELIPTHYPGSFLRLKSNRPFFVFVNGDISGEYRNEAIFNIDSLSRAVYSKGYWFAIYQEKINERDFKTEIISLQSPLVAKIRMLKKPDSDFRDFVVVSGLIIILLFLIVLRMNPKLAGDYFSVSRILSLREVEDSQSNARLTGSSNVQFYILCSLLIGFYLLISLRNLPPEFALPVRFHANGFWLILWQWIKLSTIIFYLFLLKIVVIFSLTRLFGMRGMARFHFFNWIRLLLVVFGTATIVLFIYFISRGSNADFFEIFLFVVIGALTGWIAIAFFKLGKRSEHSMFHLFSYICATEIIPLLITVKVLFE